jgi:hypothetical protein
LAQGEGQRLHSHSLVDVFILAVLFRFLISRACKAELSYARRVEFMIMNASNTRSSRLDRRAPASRRGASRRLDEMRNCLAPILTGAAIARSLSVDDRQELALKIVERQTKRLAQLLEDAFGSELGSEPDWSRPAGMEVQ